MSTDPGADLFLEGHERGALSAMAGLAAVARAERARVRLAYVRRLPGPRVDRHDRIAVPADRVMERVEAAARDALGAAARVFEDVPMEPVVRFGSPRREALLEVDAFDPGLVVLVASPGAGALARLRAWVLRRRLARLRRARLLVLQPPRAPRRRLGLAPVPLWRDVARQPR